MIIRFYPAIRGGRGGNFGRNMQFISLLVPLMKKSSQNFLKPFFVLFSFGIMLYISLIVRHNPVVSKAPEGIAYKIPKQKVSPITGHILNLFFVMNGKL